MKHLLRLALAAAIICLAPLAHAGPPSHPEVSAEIAWDPGDDRESPLWLAYLIGRAAYIDEHASAYDWKPGIVTPSFDEELAARTHVLQIYRDLKQQGKQPDVVYFEELGEVADHAFLGEYVWTYLHQAGWGSPPQKLHLVDFMHWRAEHLAQHRVMTQGYIRFATKNQPPAEAAQPAATEVSTLLEGRKAVERGQLDLAIAGFFDPVIEHFVRAHRDPGKLVYAAHSQGQVFVYVTLPNEDKKPVEVLDSTWPDAYLMKAYALTELRRVGDAQVALEKAIALSPLTAMYISELAYTYQAQGDCGRSIATYKQAESVVELGSDEGTRVADLTRAWRGQGYCLVELGRLDEAEALYRKCLKLDPSDAKARGELEYVRKKRMQ